MIDQEILRKLLSVDELPTLPEVMHKILETVGDPSTSATDLTRLLERDHAISARVLRLANSAYYGLRLGVNTIQSAVVVLGFDSIRQLALATSVLDSFSKTEQFALDPEDFWLHSLGTAKAAQILTIRCDVKDLSESAFSAGLLHDIGKYVLALVLKDEYQEIVEAAASSECLLKDVESRRIGTTHAEVGHWFAGRWRFPSVIKESIRNLYSEPGMVGSTQKATAVIGLADDLSRQAELGLAGDHARHPYAAEAARILSLSEGDLEEVIDELRPLRQEMSEFLSLVH